jgi:hypothetical protein
MNFVRSACSVMDSGREVAVIVDKPACPVFVPRARELVTLVQEVTRERFVSINKRSPMP